MKALTFLRYIKSTLLCPTIAIGLLSEDGKLTHVRYRAVEELEKGAIFRLDGRTVCQKKGVQVVENQKEDAEKQFWGV